MKILYDNAIALNNHSDGTHKTKCPQCQPPHNPQDRPLSVTIEGSSVVWFCHHCDWKGGGGDQPFQTFRRKKEYKKPQIPEVMTKSESMYSYFAKRGIHKETVDQFEIYLDGQWLAFPYHDVNKNIVNIKYRTKDKRFKQSADCEKSLYNYLNVKDSKEVIFCEGEIDVMSLAEAGFTNATSLADGAGKSANYKKDDKRFIVLQNDKYKLQATKIILFTDNDEAGKSLHQELLHRFGKDICWYVDMPSDCKDANDVLVKHGIDKLKDIVENAIPYPVDGLYTANDYKGSVIDLYNGNYVKPIEIGYSNLDDIYKILKGTFHCITGIPNHGKSYFLDQILLKLAQNHSWKFAMFSPEHSTAMHIRRLVQMYNKKAFDEGFENRMDKNELDKAMTYINDHFYFIETKDSVPDIDYILNIAKSSCLKYGVDGIVIDPYNEVSAVRKGNLREDEHIRDFISKCKRFARIHNIVVWIVAHPTKLPKNNDGAYSPPTAYDISGASHWSNQSDCILTIHRDFDDNTTTVWTRKIREQDLYGKIGEAKFKFNLGTKVFDEYDTTVDFDIPEDWQNKL